MFLPNGFCGTKGQKQKAEVPLPSPPALVHLICKRKKGFSCLRHLCLATYLVVSGLLLRSLRPAH